MLDTPDRLRAALDPDNEKLVQRLVQIFTLHLWCHGDTPGEVIQRMIRAQRAYSGLDDHAEET